MTFISETRDDNSLAPVITGFACTNRGANLIIQAVFNVRYIFIFILYSNNPPPLAFRYLNFVKQSKKK
jgi:hypothetical protein